MRALTESMARILIGNLVSDYFDVGLALFDAAESDNSEQGFSGEAFERGLIFGALKGGYEIGRKLLQDCHELGYPGPGDSEIVPGSGIRSLRVFRKIFLNPDGHGDDVFVNWIRPLKLGQRIV